jgi:hypothetical protein
MNNSTDDEPGGESRVPTGGEEDEWKRKRNEPKPSQQKKVTRV